MTLVNVLPPAFVIWQFSIYLCEFDLFETLFSRLDVMQACWHSDPECRPSFGTIINMLEPYVGSVFRANSFYLNQPSNSRRQDISQGDGERIVKGVEGDDECRERLLVASSSDPHSLSIIAARAEEEETTGKELIRRGGVEDQKEFESSISR